MAGIYVHIPFCRLACYYCDFHFSTYHKLIRPVLNAICREMQLRTDYLQGASVETVYFGGGTPSLLKTKEIHRLLDQIYKIFPVESRVEITLEANPDDLNKNKLADLKSMGINRLSIGAQTFDNPSLIYLNRAHSAEDTCLAFFNARETGFDNINLDLIYAIRKDHLDILKKDLEEINRLRPEHISAYSLTIEPRTVFGRWSDRNKITAVPDNEAADQFLYLAEILSQLGYDHYEISNYALQGFISLHNTHYWQGIPYLGLGPSAHSFDLNQRVYNLSNNALYVKYLNMGELPANIDYLSKANRINERILTGLRTKWGCDLAIIKKEFGVDLMAGNRDYIQNLIDEQMLTLRNGILTLNHKGKLFADKIASDLFVVE